MFKVSINSTPLTSSDANLFFSNIKGSNFGTDCSFLATLRALVHPRMGENDSITLKFGRSDYRADQCRANSSYAMVNAMCGVYHLQSNVGHIIIHSFMSPNNENNAACFEVIESHFTDSYPEFHRLEKVKEFYRKSFNVDCFIDPDRRNAILFVDRLDNKKLHYLQVSILAFLPWYFDPEVGVTEEEMALIYSLRETSPDKYEACIAKCAEKYDFKTARVKKLLQGFELKYERIAIDQTKAHIESIDADVISLNNRIGDMLKTRHAECIKLLGLESKVAEGKNESEIMDYFLCNKRLYLEDVSDSAMYFCVRGYLTYFDPEVAERSINNARSICYGAVCGELEKSYNGITGNQMRTLLSEIFLSDTPRIKIKFCAAYMFELHGRVCTQGHHSFPAEFADSMPNTHIDQYDCMGNYTSAINQLLIDRDYIGAIEQCVASCKSLNWTDSTVMDRFMATLWGRNSINNRCLELPDGSVVKPKDAIKWLESQEADDGTQEESEAGTEAAAAEAAQ